MHGVPCFLNFDIGWYLPLVCVGFRGWGRVLLWVWLGFGWLGWVSADRRRND